jgi:hypothetical protein
VKWRWPLCVLATLAAASCVAPALSFDAYEGKAAVTAEAALSAVRTALLTDRLVGSDDVFRPSASIAVQDAEDDSASVQGAFESIQPPDSASDRLRAQLTPLLSRASQGIQRMRIAARREDAPGMHAAARSLSPVAEALERFAELHS